jgi:hypothetical protein
MGMKGLDLDTVIRELHSSEIRVGIQTFSGGVVIWISDRSTRVRVERVFDDTSRMTIDDTASSRETWTGCHVDRPVGVRTPRASSPRLSRWCRFSDAMIGATPLQRWGMQKMGLVVWLRETAFGQAYV